LKGGDQLSARKAGGVAPVAIWFGVVVDVESSSRDKIKCDVAIIGQGSELCDVRAEREVGGALARGAVEERAIDSANVNQISHIHKLAVGRVDEDSSYMMPDDPARGCLMYLPRRVRCGVLGVRLRLPSGKSKGEYEQTGCQRKRSL